MSYVLYIIDTETTNLDYKEGDIIEISACRLIFGSEIKSEQRTWWLRALNPKGIQEQALNINGYLREDILGLTPSGKEKHRMPQEVVEEMENWLMEDDVSSIDRIFCGQNPEFDVRYLQELWRKTGRTAPADFPFAVENNNRILDTRMIITLFDICTGRRRKAYGLGQLIKACGVKKDKAHTAEGDVRMTTDLLVFCLNMIREEVAEKFKDCYVEVE